MIDFGRWTNCGNITSYVANLGISAIDYAIATHYDADHIGCLDDLVNQGVEISVACLDHGGSADTQTYDAYVAACGDKPPEVVAEVIGDLRTSLDAGRELSAAMRNHPKVFSPFYVSVIRIGEATGELDQSFNRMFGYMEFDKEIRDRIKSAVRYPIIVLVVIAVAVAVVNFFVIPAFAKIFEAQKVPLPLLTQILIGTSNFFITFWPAMLGALVAAVVGAQIYVGTEQGRYQWDRLKLRLPLAGPIILRATLARFARGMSLAVRAGVPIVQAMSVVAEVVANSYMALRIGQMREAYGGRDATSKWFESASWISFAAINDPETADYISKRCGDTTVEVDQVSRSSQMSGS